MRPVMRIAIRLAYCLCLLLLVMSAALPSAAQGDYQAIIEASKSEAEGLLIYSIMGEDNWKPLLDAFAAKYPWIKVTTTDMTSFEVFTQYYSEGDAGLRTADMIITSAPDAWLEFDDFGELEAYTSLEDSNLPDWANPIEGYYVVSTDPVMLVWNKQQVIFPLRTMAEVLALAQANPAAFAGKISTYDAETSATGFSIFWSWTQQKGEAGWAQLAELSKIGVDVKTTAGPIVTGVAQGELKIGLFVSRATVVSRLARFPESLAAGYFTDGTPIIVRGMGITARASSPNSAKLMLDFILSPEGQIAFAEGGLTAYREDVYGKAKLHLEDLRRELGEQNLIYMSVEPELQNYDDKVAFIERWSALFKPE
ncbi:MAG: ABC transporter substrate-binding protein [Anaerolineae bacterium]